MNDFLSRNKELFSSKREFLTKLREVRQKIMNNGKLTSVPIRIANDNLDNQINDLKVNKKESFFKSNLVVTSE